MKHELDMSYRKCRFDATQTNSDRCLIQRQQYARVLLRQLECGKRIVNVDESWLSQSTFHRKLWAPKDQRCATVKHTVSPRISVFAAIDTEGRCWYSLSQAITNGETFMLFMHHLAAMLEAEIPNWKETSIILFDGARYHVSPESREKLARAGYPIMMTGPYSFTSSPIETLFAALKQGELNPGAYKLGKK